jgi:hypothetical protein
MFLIWAAFAPVSALRAASASTTAAHAAADALMTLPPRLVGRSSRARGLHTARGRLLGQLPRVRTILAMPDDLPIDVLTELGRVTWAAIKLEDYTEGLCSLIDPHDPRRDRRQVGQKIRDTKRVLRSWTASAVRDEAIAWLERASQAIDRRNAALHATPVVWVGRDPPGGQRRFLGEMPRLGRPYVERPLTIESLGELRSVLEDAAAGWRDIAIAAGIDVFPARTRRANVT